MDAVFLKLLNMSITASWLCLAVLLVRLLLKKAPKALSCALWALVGLRLVLPFSLESVLSLVPSAEPLPEDMLLSPAPTINSGIPVINEVVNPVISGSLAPNPGDSVNPMQVITTVAGYLWVIGMVAMLLYTLISYLRVKGKVAEAALVEGNIYECDHIDTPFILGVIRPRIYLPSAMSEGDRAFVIAHEQAHLRRLDHVWKPLGFVLLTVYWFNPLLWLGYILLCRDIELACDEKVIKELGTDIKKQYSEALINCSVPRRAISACPLAFGEVGVKGRIKSVLNYKKPAFWIILVAVIALIVTGVCFLTDPPQKLKDPPAGTEGPTEHDFTNIDFYAWTGEYSKEAFNTAVNGYEQTGKIPVVYPDGSILRNVRISVPFAIKSCGVITPGPVVGDAATEYQYRTYTGIPTYVEGTTAYIDVSGWHRWRSEDDPLDKYTKWSYVVHLTDTEDVEHYYYFRVNYASYENSGASVLFDIDNDGQKEYCCIDYGTVANGWHSMKIYARTEDATTLKYSKEILSRYLHNSLIVRPDGTLWLGGGTAADTNISPSTEIPTQITLENGHLQLAYPYAYLANMTYDEVVKKLGEPLGKPRREESYNNGKKYVYYRYAWPFSESWNLCIEFQERTIENGKQLYVYHFCLETSE